MELNAEVQVDLLIKNGTIITETETFVGSLMIHQGKILGLVKKEFPFQTKTVLDAQNKWILPGVIDVHTHFRHMHNHADDLGDVTRSAAYGGITTVLSFISFDTKIPVEDGINRFIEAQKNSCFTDFSFHLRLFPDGEFIKQVPKAIELGINSFKISLGYWKQGLLFPDDLIFCTMEEIYRNQGILMVHAENGIIIDLLEKRFAEKSPDNPAILALSRPPFTEAEAISRVRHLAGGTGCPIYIVHLSTAMGMEEIERAKDTGIKLYVETCPQYLLLDDRILQTKKGIARIGPPLRSFNDNQSLWRGLKDGSIDTVGSDHVAYYRSSKQGLMTAPFGAPGVETLFGLILSEGVLKGRISINRLVQVLCANPAKIFGLYPKKGVIQPGSDADLVIVDPDVEYVIQADAQHTNSDFSLFEGWRLKGKPVMSILRGKVLLNENGLEQEAGYGTFIPRHPSKFIWE